MSQPGAVPLAASVGAGATIMDLIAGSDVEVKSDIATAGPDAGASVPPSSAAPAPAEKKKRAPAKSRATKKKTDDGDAADGGEGDAADEAEPTTPPKPKSKAKRTPKKPVVVAKDEDEGEEDKEVAADATEDPDATITPKSTMTKPTPKSKKRVSDAAAADTVTPTKKPRGKAVKGTPGKAGFPTSLEEFTPEDAMIFEWKQKLGQGWKAIETEYERITGIKPGTDYCRKRFPKLLAVAIKLKPEEEPALAAIKKKIEADITEEIRKLEASKWARIAAEFNTVCETDYKKEVVEKGYNDMLKEGRLNGDGDYIAPAAANDAGPAADYDAESAAVEHARLVSLAVNGGKDGGDDGEDGEMVDEA